MRPSATTSSFRSRSHYCCIYEGLYFSQCNHTGLQVAAYLRASQCNILLDNYRPFTKHHATPHVLAERLGGVKRKLSQSPTSDYKSTCGYLPVYRCGCAGAAVCTTKLLVLLTYTYLVYDLIRVLYLESGMPVRIYKLRVWELTLVSPSREVSPATCNLQPAIILGK